MPRPLRTWRTPVALGLATALVMACNATVVLLAQRIWGIDLVLRPLLTHGVLRIDTAAVVLVSGLVAASGGVLLVGLVRPCKPRFLVRSAAGQGTSCAVVLAGVLSLPAPTKVLYAVLALVAAMLPALVLARVARPRLAEYRPIPRLGDLPR